MYDVDQFKVACNCDFTLNLTEQLPDEDQQICLTAPLFCLTMCTCFLFLSPTFFQASGLNDVNINMMGHSQQQLVFAVTAAVMVKRNSKVSFF